MNVTLNRLAFGNTKTEAARIVPEGFGELVKVMQGKGKSETSIAVSGLKSVPNSGTTHSLNFDSQSQAWHISTENPDGSKLQTKFREQQGGQFQIVASGHTPEKLNLAVNRLRQWELLMQQG